MHKTTVKALAIIERAIGRSEEKAKMSAKELGLDVSTTEELEHAHKVFELAGEALTAMVPFIKALDPNTKGQMRHLAVAIGILDETAGEEIFDLAKKLPVGKDETDEGSWEDFKPKSQPEPTVRSAKTHGIWP